MADISEKWEDNVDGKYYIDKSCSICGVCAEEAPDNIKESDDGDHCIIFKQPSSPEEEEAMKSAIESCPSESIGSDGA